MKKKILSILLIGVVSCSLISCGNTKKDTVNTSLDSTQDNRFIDMGDKYYIGSEPYKVYYDKTTNIVYIADDSGIGYGTVASITTLYGKDKQPMTIDEYNKTK
jgi:thioredoxin-related protein